MGSILQPTEKSPGLKPRNERSRYGAKHNASLQFKKDENKVKKEEVSLEESFNDFKIVKSAGYGSFLMSKDMGINMQGAFAHHPSVEEEIKELEKKN